MAANNKQTKVSRVSELPVINKIWDGMKTIVAYNRKNYLIDVNAIKGRRIIDMNEIQSDESGGKNIIYIDFDDNKTDMIYVFNGSEGEKGQTGKGGEKGNQGESGYINPNGRGITGTMYIVNNSETRDPNLPWSAYRGKDMNDKIYDINETFVSESEFNLLFSTVKYIYAEFKTTTDNKKTQIFNADNNSHITYRKYWTYEDDGTRTYYIYNPNSNTVDKEGNVIKYYDQIEADIWKDIYLGKTSGYFLITSSMKTDSTPIYYYDKSDNTYKLVEKVNVEKESDDGIVEVYLGDKHISNYYIPEIDTYISANYAILNDKWTISVNATSTYIPDVYKTIDGINYTKLTKEEILNIDTTVYAQYYQYKDGKYDLIDNIESYITPKDIRYYKRNYVEDGNDYTYVNNGKYCEVPEEEINRDSLTEDFLIVSFNKLTNTYTFERYYPGKLFGEDVQFNDTVTLSSIDLYYYTDNRVYYSNILVRQPNGTYESEYIPVEIPSWIYAEFKTVDEDQTSIILNANDDTTGKQEHNEIIDTTSESLDDNVDIENIFRIVPGNKDNLYIKTGDNRYELVNLAKDVIYPTSEYYSWDGRKYIYTQISGTEALNKNRLNIYTRENNVYKVITDNIDETKTYWLQSPAYVLVEDPETYLNTYDLVLFTDEPKLLSITIYPATNRSYVTIEYDPKKIVFFENGRIAATVGKDYDTLLTISSENSDAVAYVNVKVTTPMKEITFNENNKVSIDINSSTEFYYTVGPDNASNKNVVWEYDSNIIEITELSPNENGSRIRIYGKNTGKFNLVAKAEDTYGATQSIGFEIVTPAASINWREDDENIIYVPAEYYTSIEAKMINNEHYYEEGWVNIKEGDLKSEAYYSMIVLLYKEYLMSPEILPNDTTYQQMIWESSNPLVAEVLSRTEKVVDVQAVKKEITIEDVNNGIKDYLGNDVTEEQIGTVVTLVNEVSHNELRYYLTSTAIGNVKITGYIERYPDLRVYVNVRVDQSIEEINIIPEVLSLNINTRKKLTAEILPTTAVNGTISWHSSNEDIVSISPTGTITANAVGSTTIIARAEDGSNVTGVCNVKVTIPSKDITLRGDTDNGIIYLGIGKTTTINADITHNTSFGTNESNMNKAVNWLSSDTSVATIQKNNATSAIVTGLKIGKTTIIANAEDGSGVFGTIQLRVIQLAQEISFSLDTVEMEVNDSLVLIPTFTPANTSNEIVIWSSSDETIAKVKESGIVYALKEGTAQITAKTTDGTELTATCTVIIS